MKRFVYSALILAMGSNIACSGGGSGRGGGSAVPSTFRRDLRTEMTKTKPLSPDTKNRFGLIFKANAAVIPATSLVFNDHEGAQKRESDFGKLNEDGRAFLEEIKSHCEITPERVGDSDTPPEVGKTVTNEKSKSISGSKCPISYFEKSRVTQALSALDMKTFSISGTFKTESQQSMTIVSEKMKSKAMTAANSFQSTVSGILENVAAKSGKMTQGAQYIEGDMNGWVVLASGEKVSMTLQLESIERPGSQNYQFLVTLKFPQGQDLVIGGFKKDEKTEVYLNGELYSEERLKEEFAFEVGDLLK